MGDSPTAVLPGRALTAKGPRGRVGGRAKGARDAAPLVLQCVTTCADWGCAGGGEKGVEGWAQSEKDGRV
jgi:hypothetical protein